MVCTLRADRDLALCQVNRDHTDPQLWAAGAAREPPSQEVSGQPLSMMEHGSVGLPASLPSPHLWCKAVPGLQASPGTLGTFPASLPHARAADEHSPWISTREVLPCTPDTYGARLPLWGVSQMGGCPAFWLKGNSRGSLAQQREAEVLGRWSPF